MGRMEISIRIPTKNWWRVYLRDRLQMHGFYLQGLSFGVGVSGGDAVLMATLY